MLLGYVGLKAYITSDIYKEFNGIDSATASLLFSRKTVVTNARDKIDLGGIIKPLSLKKDNSSSIACVIKTNYSSDCGNKRGYWSDSKLSENLLLNAKKDEHVLARFNRQVMQANSSLANDDSFSNRLQQAITTVEKESNNSFPTANKIEPK